MTHDATHHDALSHLPRWRPRRPADPVEPGAVDDRETPPAPPPGSEPAFAPPRPRTVDTDALAALLSDLDELRLSLSADMGVLASAVELRAFEVAAEVVDGERADLAAFADRVTARGSQLAPDPAAEVGLPAVDRVAPRSLGRTLRAALPAAPAMAAAAALVGLLAGLAPTQGASRPEGGPSVHAAATSYAQLFLLHERGASEQTLRAAVHDLHAEVARIMTLAAHDPAAAEQALRLLARQVGGIDDDEHRADLRSVLAESQRLLGVLEAAVTTGSMPTGVRLPGGPSIAPQPAPQPGPTPPGALPTRNGGTEPGGTTATPRPGTSPGQGGGPGPSPSSNPSQEPSSAPDDDTPAPGPSPGLWPPNGSTVLPEPTAPPGGG